MLCFNPIIPDKWNKYTFKINFRGCTLQVEIGKNEIKISMTEGDELNILVYEVVYHANRGKELIIRRN